MKIKYYEDQFQWMEDRRTRITGSRLGDVVVLRGDGEKKAFYELIAERLAVARPIGEKVMERGHELEQIAIELAEKQLGKVFIKDLVIWEREDNSSISISPDGYTEELTEAIEVKCLCSADHIKAVIENEYPKDYRWQVLQYFIVNDKLETLFFVMYDPSLSVHSLKIFEITRKELEKNIDKYLEYQKAKLEKVSAIIKELSF